MEITRDYQQDMNDQKLAVNLSLILRAMRKGIITQAGGAALVAELGL